MTKTVITVGREKIVAATDSNILPRSVFGIPTANYPDRRRVVTGSNNSSGVPDIVNAVKDVPTAPSAATQRFQAPTDIYSLRFQTPIESASSTIPPAVSDILQSNIAELPTMQFRKKRGINKIEKIQSGEPVESAEKQTPSAKRESVSPEKMAIIKSLDPSAKSVDELSYDHWQQYMNLAYPAVNKQSNIISGEGKSGFEAVGREKVEDERRKIDEKEEIKLREEREKRQKREEAKEGKDKPTTQHKTSLEQYRDKFESGEEIPQPQTLFTRGKAVYFGSLKGDIAWQLTYYPEEDIIRDDTGKIVSKTGYDVDADGVFHFPGGGPKAPFEEGGPVTKTGEIALQPGGWSLPETRRGPRTPEARRRAAGNAEARDREYRTILEQWEAGVDSGEILPRTYKFKKVMEARSYFENKESENTENK